MKKINFIWVAMPILAALVVYFGYLRVLPTFVKVILLATFAAIWFCRKQIADTVISKLKHIPALDHFMWDDAGQKKDENGKLTQERKPIESNIKLIKLGVSAAILLIMLGIPMLIYGIFMFIFGILNGFTNAMNIIFQDLAFGNGVGFFIFALFEIIITIASIAAIMASVVKYKNLDWDAKKSAIIGGGAFALQRIFSWFYFGVGFGGALGEIFFWALIIGGIWAIIKFDLINKIRAWRKSRPIDTAEVDDSEAVDAEIVDSDEGFIDPI